MAANGRRDSGSHSLELNTVEKSGSGQENEDRNEAVDH